MMRLRPIVRSVLCCLLCLTVCVVPALAANDQYTDGVIYPQSGLSINYTVGDLTKDVLAGYFPASFGSEAINSTSMYGRHFRVVGKALPRPAGTYSFSSTTASQFYIEVLFGVPAPLSFQLAQSGSTGSVSAKIGFGRPADLSSLSCSSFSADISFVVDNKLIPLVVSSDNNFTPAFGSYDCDHYFGYRFYFNPLSFTYSTSSDMALKLVWDESNLSYTFSDPNYVESINDQVTVNTGILKSIDGKLTDIQLNTAYLMGDVFEIKNDLRDSSSSIWGAFKDSVSGLFVPSSADLEGVKNGFDQLAKDKLGGAYQSVDLVKDGVSQVRDKINNPTLDYSVEFPGIEVPLGETYGTVRLIGRQDVTIPQKMRDVLYPIAGIIIPIVCTTWTVRLGIDMVNCFMSGMSYAQFLHRFTDSEDDEA